MGAPPGQAEPPSCIFTPPQDCFFYSLVFDPVQKTLLADQGEIRVGCKYQAEIPERLGEGLGGLRCFLGGWVVGFGGGGGRFNRTPLPAPPRQVNRTTATSRKWR